MYHQVIQGSHLICRLWDYDSFPLFNLLFLSHLLNQNKKRRILFKYKILRNFYVHFFLFFPLPFKIENSILVLPLLNILSGSPNKGIIKTAKLPWAKSSQTYLTQYIKVLNFTFIFYNHLSILVIHFLISQQLCNVNNL